jgi:ATP-dependent 26S proteasome regulatory subunit
LDPERFIVKASSGPRYVVGCRTRLNHDKLAPGTRVALDMTTIDHYESLATRSRPHCLSHAKRRRGWWSEL